jgi:hypothetical protein
MAESLGSIPGQNPLLNRPDIAQAMARIYKDASKFDGIPLMTVTKVGISAQAANAAASTPAVGTTAAPAADSTPKSSSSAQGNASAALAQALGGRFGLGRHKKDDNNSTASSSGSGDSSDASGSLLEMTGQVNNFNSDSVDAAIFNIPAGFSQVDAKLPGGKHR